MIIGGLGQLRPRPLEAKRKKKKNQSADHSDLQTQTLTRCFGGGAERLTAVFAPFPPLSRRRRAESLEVLSKFFFSRFLQRVTHAICVAPECTAGERA